MIKHDKNDVAAHLDQVDSSLGVAVVKLKHVERLLGNAVIASLRAAIEAWTPTARA